MTKTRQYTNILWDMGENNIIEWKEIARTCLKYMSEADVKDMVLINDLIEKEE